VTAASVAVIAAFAASPTFAVAFAVAALLLLLPRGVS